jgi:hypothetical protein
MGVGEVLQGCGEGEGRVGGGEKENKTQRELIKSGRKINR